jgi:CPA2 family monovalent cation:H+ antiporter-2
MVKVNPIVGYLFLVMVVSAVRPELLSAGGTVHLLAELGVVFLLFDIGLHFSTAHVRREAGDIFGFGPLQVSASTILIAGCAWALGLSPIAALVVGTTLALSSTAIVARVIADRRQQNCPVALTAIAILIFQDVAAIFLLILTTMLENGSAGPVVPENSVRADSRMRQNQRIIWCDACDPPSAWDICRQPVQVATPA